jgi:hypothetical protein
VAKSRTYTNGVDYAFYEQGKNKLNLTIHKKMKIGADGRFPLEETKKEMYEQLNRILASFPHKIDYLYRVQIYVLVGYFSIVFDNSEDFLAFNLKYAQSSYGFEQD